MIITEPSQANDSSFNSMNMEGVEESAVNTAYPPVFSMPRSTPSERAGAEMRESCPTATRTEDLPVRSSRNRQKAAAMFSAVPGVRFTSSPSTPAEATPLTSVPFLSCSYSRKVAMRGQNSFLLLFSRRPARMFSAGPCEYCIICFYYNVFHRIFQAFYENLSQKFLFSRNGRPKSPFSAGFSAFCPVAVAALPRRRAGKFPILTKS